MRHERLLLIRAGTEWVNNRCENRVQRAAIGAATARLQWRIRAVSWSLEEQEDSVTGHDML